MSVDCKLAGGQHDQVGLVKRTYSWDPGTP